MGEKKKHLRDAEVVSSPEVVETEVARELGERAFSLDDLTLAEFGNERPLARIEEGLYEKIIGQREALGSLVTALYRENLRNPNRPLAVLMFLGPTGVGKTETAKVMDELLHGEGADTLLKIDCSNYSENHRVSALLGAAPEYVGREQAPVFDKKKIERPKSIILFDEIEKGAPKLFDLLLQILDDGEVTLLNGNKKVSFKNSIIILSSNVGAKEIQKTLNKNGIGFRDPSVSSVVTRKELEAVANNALKSSVFRPEFINRIDEKIIFEPLNDEQIGQVLDLNVANANKYYEKQGVHLTLTPELRNELVASTPERHEFGARPILAKYRKLVEGMLAKIYTSGGIPGGSHVYAVLSEKERSDAAIEERIKLYHRSDEIRFPNYATKQQAPKHAEKITEESDDEAKTMPIDRNKMAIGMVAAAGIVSLFVGDYLSSRRAGRTRRAY